jgi:hypothetical protein
MSLEEESLHNLCQQEEEECGSYAGVKGGRVWVACGQMGERGRRQRKQQPGDGLDGRMEPGAGESKHDPDGQEDAPGEQLQKDMHDH